MFGENHFPLRRALLKFIDMAVGRMVSWGKIWVISRRVGHLGHYRRVQGVEGSREML